MRRIYGQAKLIHKKQKIILKEGLFNERNNR